MPALTPVPRRTVLRLRPATLDDRRAIYEALARSDVTPHLLPGTGSGTGGEPPLSFEAFAADYTAPFFDGSAPALGRSYVVECDGLPVGHVSHSEIRRGATELDIWMFGERWCGRGHGTVALRLLLDVLAAEGRATGFVIRPSARNARAVRSYEKAGFRRTPLAQDDVVRWFGPDDVADPVHLSTGLVPGDGGPPAPAPPHVVTRRPATPADRERVGSVFRAAYREIVERVHGVWDDDAVRGDLDRKWARGGFEVVGARGRPVGAIWTTDEDGAGGAPWSRLRELVLDPAEQRRGIGTALVRDEIARARRRGRGLRLRVLWASDARRLYARLGFVERERVGEKVWMELEPSADRG